MCMLLQRFLSISFDQDLIHFEKKVYYKINLYYLGKRRAHIHKKRNNFKWWRTQKYLMKRDRVVHGPTV